MAELENINPNVYKKTEERTVLKSELIENEVDPIDEREVFGESRFLKSTKALNLFFLDLIRNINDPEHPLTLEELHVLEQSRVIVDDKRGEVFVQFTPTIPVTIYFYVLFMQLTIFSLPALFNGNAHRSKHPSQANSKPSATL